MKGPCLHYMAGTTNTQKFRFTDEFSTDFGSSSSDGIFISVSLGVVEKVIIVDVNPGDGKDCDWWVTSRSWYFDGGTRTAKAINAYTGMNGFLYKSCYIEGQNGREYVWGHMVFP